MSILLVALAIVAGLALLLVLNLVVLTGMAARQAGRMVPPVGRFATVDGVRLHYLDEGTGPPIVMIHGLASQLQSFTYALSERLRPAHRILMIDRPGSGYSQAAGSGTLRLQARLVAGLMAQLDLGPALVVGQSLGGAVALALAVDHPEQVAGLALVSPATQPQAAPPSALTPLAIRSDLVRWIVGWTVAVPAAIRARAAVLETLFAPDPVPDDFATRGGAVLASRPSAFRAACRDLVEGGGEIAAYAARHAGIRVPVGVLYGDGDRILDPRLHGEGLRRALPDTVLEMLPEGGHMIPLVRADETAAFVERMAAMSGVGADTVVAAKATSER